MACGLKKNFRQKQAKLKFFHRFIPKG